MSQKSSALNLRVPQQTLDSLSFAEHSVKGISQWIAELPKANIGETARQLYQGLIELNQLKISPDRRLAILEQVRTQVHYVCSALSRYYLGQSVVLDERPRQVARLSQSLQSHLATGYKIVVMQEGEMSARSHAAQLSLAIQRALGTLGAPLLHAYQLYSPVPAGNWLEIHQLFQLARLRELQQERIKAADGADRPEVSIERTYISALLLGTARLNQVRQSSMGKLYGALPGWSSLVELVEASSPHALFIINPQLDSPPRYRSLLQEQVPDGCLGLDTRRLVNAIKHQLTDGAKASGQLQVPDAISAELLQHVSESWGDLAERSFDRTPGQGELRVSIGMSAIHFHIAGTSFAHFINTEDSNPFSAQAQRARQEGWSTAFDAGHTLEWSGAVEQIDYSVSKAAADEETAAHYPIHKLQIVNHSPGGFCLTWPREVPRQLQAGELLGVQEHPGQAWSLAVVRWIRQAGDGGTQMGIELIAPNCTPCAIKLLRKADHPSNYLRALWIAEVPALDRPASVLTPRIPFETSNKVQLLLKGREHRAQLLKRISATGSYSQFEHRLLEAPVSNKNETQSTGLSLVPEDDFDSLWKSL